MTSSLGGSSLGSPQNDQVMLPEVVPAPAGWAWAWVGAAAADVGPVAAGALVEPPEPLWQAASSEAALRPRPASPAMRSNARRDRLNGVCGSCISWASVVGSRAGGPPASLTPAPRQG